MLRPKGHLIRTFLSLALEVELEGRWPWKAGGQLVMEKVDIKHAVSDAS